MYEQEIHRSLVRQAAEIEGVAQPPWTGSDTDPNLVRVQALHQETCWE